MLGIGLIGLGAHGKCTLGVNAMQNVNVRIVAACDTDHSKKDIAAEHGIPFFTTDINVLLGRDDVDAIAVFVGEHYESIIAALNAHKHIITTKPLAESLDQAREIALLRREVDKQVMVIETYRSERMGRLVRQIYDDGLIGNVITGEASYIHDYRPVVATRPWAREVKMLLHGMVHPLSFIRWFMGDPVRVACMAGRSPFAGRQMVSPDNYQSIMEFEDGRIARTTMLLGIVDPPQRMFTYGLYGDKGSIVDDVLVRDNLRSFNHKPAGLDKWTDAARLPIEAELDRGMHDRTIPEVLLHFGEVLAGNEKPICTFEDSLKDLLILFAMERSYQEKQFVDVDYTQLPL